MELNEYLEQINTIMWESFMIKDCSQDVKDKAVIKIMGVLENWCKDEDEQNTAFPTLDEVNHYIFKYIEKNPNSIIKDVTLKQAEWIYHTIIDLTKSAPDRPILGCTSAADCTSRLPNGGCTGAIGDCQYQKIIKESTKPAPDKEGE